MERKFAFKKHLLRPQVLLLTLVGFVLAISFTNCGPGFQTSESLDLASLGSLSKCEQELYQAFSAKIHPFTAKNCAGCHNVNGASNVFFAQPNKISAFKAFLLPGFDKFQTYALNPGHVSGITGTQNQSVIDEAESLWANAEGSAACQSQNGSDEFEVLTDAVPINATATNKTILWNLWTQVAKGTIRSGATIQINARVVTPAGSVPTYYLSSPVLKTSTEGLTIKRISVYINGEEFIEGTTFHAVDKYIAPSTTTTVSLSPNTLLIQFPNLNPAQDTIALKIGYLNVGDSAGGDDGGEGGGPPTSGPGVMLYSQHCASCHGILTSSSKRGRSATQIQNAINTRSQMMSLSFLTPQQVSDIARALDY